MGGPGPRLNHPAGPGRDVHLAVRAVLREHTGGRVVVGVSGGADSLALLGAAVGVAGPLRVSVAAVCVDHGWHPRTVDVAVRVARAALQLGADRVRVVRVVPARRADGGPVGGPEDAARTARLRALQAAAERDGATAVLLGHTLDDQAEQVLIGLARGSGARSLAGMPARRGPFVRPFLGLRRDVVRAACPSLPDLGLPWHDPTNDPTDDPTDHPLLRARVRAELLPVLVDVLGDGAVTSLARSADLLREDDAALRDRAEQEVSALLGPARSGVPGTAVEVALDPLRALPGAVRTRALRLLAARAGARALTSAHSRALDGLVLGGRGHGPVSLPGPVTASRTTGPDGCGRLRLAVDHPPREDLHGRR